VREPSLRFNAAESPGDALADELAALGLPPAEPVLPLPGVARTLVIADTSGLHCRGRAPAGTRRVAMRPMGAHNDGGAKRTDPFAPF